MTPYPARCDECGQVMLIGTGCTSTVAYRWCEEPDWQDDPDGLPTWRCGDCGTPPGERHHPGCTTARCAHGCRNPFSPDEADHAAFCRHQGAYSVAVH